MPDTEKGWTDAAKKLLVGKTIKRVSYMTRAEAQAMDWLERALVIELDDGTVLFPSQDDEGNNAGALFTSDDTLGTIPVLRA